MRAYVVRRLLLVIPTVILVSILVFLVIRLIPGNIVDMMAAESQWHSEITKAVIEKALGLDQPIYVQYGRWIGVLPGNDGSFNGLFQGSLGASLWADIPVVKEIASAAPVTAELGILSILLTFLISLPIGIYSAIRQDTVGDYSGRSFATLLIALPNFWVGIMIILFASIWFGMSPPLKPTPFLENPAENLGQFIVPAFVLAMAATGGTMRMMRSMMLEVLRQDYIRTAWAKGLRERVVILRHALKNAFIPVVTMLGIQLRDVLGGAIIIENVFSLPGMGQLMVEATLTRDYPIVSGVVFIFAAFMVLINLGIDLTYGYLDPRVRYE